MATKATKHKILRPLVTNNGHIDILNLPNDIIYLADTDDVNVYNIFSEKREFIGVIYDYQRTGEYISKEINN